MWQLRNIPQVIFKKVDGGNLFLLVQGVDTFDVQNKLKKFSNEKKERGFPAAVVSLKENFSGQRHTAGYRVIDISKRAFSHFSLIFDWAKRTLEIGVR